jgi:hypothetical protein
MPPGAPDAGEALFHVVDAAYDKTIDPRSEQQSPGFARLIDQIGGAVP